MGTLFAHSENSVNDIVRQYRRDQTRAPQYCRNMRTRITEIRKERGLTLEALAELSGISKSYLSEMSSGKKPINSARLSALARALGCNPIDLIDDESVDKSVMEHIRILSDLSEEDRQAVIRHAAVLAMKSASHD